MIRPLHSFCIIADDLSGAADCAAAFARVGGPVPVYLGEVGDGADCIAMDLDSRTMDTTQAVAMTTRVFERMTRSGSEHGLVYKKIDSTLRGHVGTELAAALLAAPQFAGAVIAPAFPEQGRSLVGGQLRVHGRAVDSLGHAGDLIGLLHMAGLPAALLDPGPDGPQLARRIADAVRTGTRVVVVDALDRADLDRLAGALCSADVPRLLVVGSSGLARSLAAHVQRPPPEPDEADQRQVGGPVMAVVGSFSQASSAQVQQVQDCGGAQVIRLEADQWVEPQHADLRQKTLVIARQHLRSERNVLFAIGGEPKQPFSRSMVRAMARATAPLLAYAGTCVLTGGDTARAMFNELGADRIDVSGEFEPGISFGRTGSHPAGFVLKAGGFGDASALQRIIGHYGEDGRSPPARQVAPT
jgi:uncharacterized protein YgbK (DUF1537 family)